MISKHAILLTMSFTVTLAGAAHADDVEIYLKDILDNIQVGYCVDIAKGKGEKANPDDGLQGHTCYSNLGALGYDQTFDTEMFEDNTLYMKNFDVCVTSDSTESGASLALADCDGSEKQSFNFSGDGTITPANAPDLCFTLAEATRTGRSDSNQIKVLTLEKCSEALSPYQDWAVRGVDS